MTHEQIRLLDIVQTVERGSGTTYRTTVCPIRVDGHELPSRLGSAALGEHDDLIHAELGLR